MGMFFKKMFIFLYLIDIEEDIKKTCYKYYYDL